MEEILHLSSVWGYSSIADFITVDHKDLIITLIIVTKVANA